MPKGGKHYSNLQPRFSMAYNWGRDVVSLDISRMAQFYHYFRFYGMDFPTDLRMPSINQFKPQTSVHTELGWKHYLMEDIQMHPYITNNGIKSYL